YVQQFISQSRNSVSSFVASATTGLNVGDIVNITMTAVTSSAYPELFIYPTFSNNNFRVISTQVFTPTANQPTPIADTFSLTNVTGQTATNDKFYTDAGGWDNNPASPTYLSVVGPAQIGGGKVGGNITIRYTVQVVGLGSAT